MEIRHAQAREDAAACAEIYRPFVLSSAVSFEERAPGADQLVERIERVAASHPWLVAVQAGTIVGFAYATHHRTRPAYRWAADVAAYVREGDRRRGVGRALYGALLPLLARQGLHVACAGITLPNDASVALHEACGFQSVGVYRRIGWKAGAWRDVGWWQAELLPAGSEPPPEPGPPTQLANDAQTAP